MIDAVVHVLVERHRILCEERRRFIEDHLIFLDWTSGTTASSVSDAKRSKQIAVKDNADLDSPQRYCHVRRKPSEKAIFRCN